MRRTREYYAAIGYTTPYRWAHYLTGAVHPAAQAAERSRRSRSSPPRHPTSPDKGDQGPGAAYNGSAKFYQVYSGDTAHDHDLRISHIGYDRTHTTATDSNTWFPAAGAAPRRRRPAASAPSPRASTARRPTAAIASRSKPTRRRSCARVREDGADVAIVVPNCPVCHQTSSLVARHLEANGIPTVLMGCAKDIVEHAAAPRFLFSDFPLGNSAGKPHDVASQDQTLELALRLLETAAGPQTTMQSPLRWNEDGRWKLDYLNLEQIGEEELKRRREEFDRQKELARPNRDRVKAA